MPSGEITDSQTTVISVAINQKGNKFATLQFVDGSTLEVEIGSKLGIYSVFSIDMDGIKLAHCKGRRCTTKVIKRAYPQQITGQDKNKPKTYMATPVLGGSSNSPVPPLVFAK